MTSPATGSLSHPEQNRPWLFGALVVPYGFTTAVSTILIPYLLRKNGVPVDRIAEVVAVANLPAIWSFLWSPLADAGLRYRTCILISAIAAGLTGASAMFLIHASLTLLTVFLFAANAFVGLLGSSCGALLTRMPAALHGRAAGWYQTGNIGAGAVAGGSVIWLADHASLMTLAVAIAAFNIVPALAAILVREAAPVRRSIAAQASTLFHEIRDVLSSGRTWLGLLFFLSPVGTAAVANLISGVGPDYHASANEVLLVSGIAGGLLSAAGSFFGGFLADRMNRMLAYALVGVLTAAAAAYMAFGPHTALTYGAGYAAYAIAAGIGYAVYTALLLDVVGHGKRNAATTYSFLNASGNVSITYMTWADGVGYKRAGISGLMGTDAGANIAFAVILGVVAILARAQFSAGRSTRSTTT